MKVLHFSLSDFGGAGAAAFRLHHALLAANVDSRLLVLSRSRRTADGVYAVPALNRWIYWILSRISDRWVKGSARKSEHAQYFYPDFNHALLTPQAIARLGLRPDVIVVHSVPGFVPASLLSRMSDAWGTPMIWYLMDMGPLTGGCHFAFSCTKYQEQCGNCPAIQSHREEDWSRRFWRTRRRVAESVNGVVVAPNHWLERQVTQSGIFRDMPLKYIELSIDLETYRPHDRLSARRALGVPEAGPVIFFGAHYVDEERKGIRYLVEALQLLKERLTAGGLARPTIITAGNTLAANSLNLPLPHYHLGLLDAEKQLPLAYQAADVFVSATVEDSGPMMVLEALACGTPVAAFDIGVARDVLLDGVTGYVAKPRDAADLATGIERILALDGPASRSMSAACRDLAVQRFAPAVQAQAFKDLISSMQHGTQEERA